MKLKATIEVGFEGESATEPVNALEAALLRGLGHGSHRSANPIGSKWLSTENAALASIGMAIELETLHSMLSNSLSLTHPSEWPEFLEDASWRLSTHWCSARISGWPSSLEMRTTVGDDDVEINARMDARAVRCSRDAMRFGVR